MREGRETIGRVARQLIQEKKQKVEQGEKTGKTYESQDLLSLLRTFFVPTLVHLLIDIVNSQI